MLRNAFGGLMLSWAFLGAVSAQPSEPAPFPEIAAAKAAFAKEKETLDHTYRADLTKLRARYIERLTAIRIDAVTKGNVELAQDALFRAKEVEKELLVLNPPEAAPEPPSPKGRIVAKELVGKRFMCQTVTEIGTMKLLANGRVEGAHPDDTWSISADGTKLQWANKGVPSWSYALTRYGKAVYGIGPYLGHPEVGIRAIRELP